jgi:hypothetical protein
MKQYSFFIDDNIFFLKEIASQKLKSIFDHFYLAKLKEFHQKYQTKFLLNLFKGDQNSGFMLDEFPETYKEEFIANNHWLRLSFHAAFDKTHYFNAPNCIASTAAEFIRDYNYVKREVERFAGEEAFLVPQIIHYVDSSKEIKQFLYDEGVRFLADRRKTFEELSLAAGEVVKSFPDSEVAQLTRIPFELVINNVPLDDVIPELDIRIVNEKRNYISLMTHEPQFYSNYWHYIPEHWERLDRTFSYLAKNGYTPVWGSLITKEDL